MWAREAPAIQLCQVSVSVTCREDEPAPIKELLPELPTPGSFCLEVLIAEPLQALEVPVLKLMLNWS